jgi:hypothetical protein
VFTQKLILTALLAATSVIATPPSMYHGKPINAETLLELIPPIPGELKTKIEEAFKRHPELSSVLSGESYSRIIPGTSHAPFSIDFDQISTEDRQYFFEPLRKRLATTIPIPAGKLGPLVNNFTIPLDEQLFIKASGLLNRRANILHEMGLNNQDHELPQAKLDEFMATKGGRTFQTISRMVYLLRAKQAKEELHLDRICLPEKYLMHIPGRPTDLDDTNYIVVAKKLSNVTPILDTDLLKDKTVVTQLAQVIRGASSWDIHGGNVVAQGDKACLIDFEQPNAFKPSEFGRGGIMGGGIEGLKNLIKDYAKKSNLDKTSLEELTKLVDSQDN